MKEFGAQIRAINSTSGLDLTSRLSTGGAISPGVGPGSVLMVSPVLMPDSCVYGCEQREQDMQMSGHGGPPICLPKNSVSCARARVRDAPTR